MLKEGLCEVKYLHRTENNMDINDTQTEILFSLSMLQPAMRKGQ